VSVSTVICRLKVISNHHTALAQTPSVPCPKPQYPCIIGWIWNDFYCSCRRVCATTLTCPSGSYFNTDTCQCVKGTPFVCASYYPCVNGFSWNRSLCYCEKCVASLCPKGMIWNQTQCRCTVCPVQTCGKFMRWDAETCNCITSRCALLTCTPPKTFNQTTCTCV
jgi:hypothetical protein